MWVLFQIDYPGRLAIVAASLVAYWIIVVLMRRAIRGAGRRLRR